MGKTTTRTTIERILFPFRAIPKSNTSTCSWILPNDVTETLTINSSNHFTSCSEQVQGGEGKQGRVGAGNHHACRHHQFIIGSPFILECPYSEVADNCMQ
ncbi:hypothetical protein BgiBS90_033938 [Biomphalaria glabrata]|nr:hypothetical protein BgiBS90_033938 [Biomphalaria glabrata]KAI8747530.1 hypothetical protein BgiMline_019248 [Biomphalaria glabrata]